MIKAMASAANTSSLYILVFPSCGLLKIGKANNVRARVRTLRQWWGDADYTESFELVAPQTTVLHLEKSLHFLLSARQADVANADGYTEMYSLTSLGLILKHIDLFMASGSAPLGLTKGLLAPQDMKPDVRTGQRRAQERNWASAGVAAIGHVGVMAWAIYCIIKSEATSEETSSSPPITRIAEMVGISHDTVTRALATLECAGMLRIDKSRGKRSKYAWD